MAKRVLTPEETLFIKEHPNYTIRQLAFCFDMSSSWCWREKNSVFGRKYKKMGRSYTAKTRGEAKLFVDNGLVSTFNYKSIPFLSKQLSFLTRQVSNIAKKKSGLTYFIVSPNTDNATPLTDKEIDFYKFKNKTKCTQ